MLQLHPASIIVWSEIMSIFRRQACMTHERFTPKFGILRVMGSPLAWRALSWQFVVALLGPTLLVVLPPATTRGTSRQPCHGRVHQHGRNPCSLPKDSDRHLPGSSRLSPGLRLLTLASAHAIQFQNPNLAVVIIIITICHVIAKALHN